MPIYTKTGDKGETSLFGGKRILKSDPQIATYGTIDELTSFLGMLTVKLTDRNEQDFLVQTQKELYQIMGFLAGAPNPIDSLAERVTFFEKKIDEIEAQLPKLHRFILPGGTETASWFHIARTTCRRAERECVLLSTISKLDEKNLFICIQYLNRLSDLLFDLARWHSKEVEILT
jgi:cob(I)alamin adenosyltransferase